MTQNSPASGTRWPHWSPSPKHSTPETEKKNSTSAKVSQSGRGAHLSPITDFPLRSHRKPGEMGRMYVEYVEGTAYRCKCCGCHLATADELISKVPQIPSVALHDAHGDLLNHIYRTEGFLGCEWCLKCVGGSSLVVCCCECGLRVFLCASNSIQKMGEPTCSTRWWMSMWAGRRSG